MRYATKYGIPERCRLGTEVVSIDRNGSGWKVFVRPTGNGKASVEVITCDKLIVCTGITSKPRPIDFDLGSFDGISFHAIEMGKRHTELVTDEIKNVTVVGGHKSALEVVGTCAQAGKNVEWLIREHGGGPTWLMPPRNPDGTAASKMSTKRAISFFSTSVYHSDRWLNRFLHSGRWRVGSYFIARIWNYMTKMMQGDKYSKSENGKKLKPHPEK
jgi:dimethylaniline monooxygenase (N-oxide forming)